jgi:hypothetical protein
MTWLDSSLNHSRQQALTIVYFRFCIPRGGFTVQQTDVRDGPEIYLSAINKSLGLFFNLPIYRNLSADLLRYLFVLPSSLHLLFQSPLPGLVIDNPSTYSSAATAQAFRGYFSYAEYPMI